MSLELTRTGVKLLSTEEDIEGTLISFIQDYQLVSLYLKYERKDDPKNGTACFNFWLSGVGLNKEEHILLHLQELLQGFPALVKQLQEIAAGAGVNFYNSFNEDGYIIHCQAIHRRINRK
jgi:hypothetical protein